MPGPISIARSLLCSSVILLLIAGCGGSASPGSSDPTVLRWGVVGLGDASTLDPALASDPTSISLASMIYGGLVRLDGRLRVRPDGARRWSISPDGMTYTFHLRHDLRFADGHQVTAADFVTSLRRALGPAGTAGGASFYLGLIARQAGVPAVTARSKYTVRIRLRQPAAHFLAQLAFPSSFVVDSRQVAANPANWTDHARGFGPYYVKTWTHSQSLLLVRNPYYYGGRPPLAQIDVRFFPEADAAIAAYRRHRLDLVTGFPPGEPQADRIAGALRLPSLAQDYLAFNTRRLPFKHLSVRRAFAAAWSPRLVSAAMSNAAFPATSFVPSSFDISSPLIRWRRSPSAYLRRGGYNGDRFPPTTLIVPRDPAVAALARALVKRWQDVLGVTINAREVNLSDYSQALNTHTFDLAIVRWGADFPDPQDYLGTQLAQTSNNVTGWSGHAFDDAVLLSDSYDPLDSRRRELYAEAAAIAARKLPLLPLDEPAIFGLRAPYVHGIALTPMGTIAATWTRARLSS